MGLLRVTVRDSLELAANAVKLHLQVKGQGFSVGAVALEEVPELKALVQALPNLAASQWQVAGVELRDPAGFERGKPFSFELTLTVSPEQLAQALEVLAQQKLRLRALQWQFDEQMGSKSLAVRAMKTAQDKAQAVAEAAGYRITGIHLASDSLRVPETAPPSEEGEALGFSADTAARSFDVDGPAPHNSLQTMSIELVVDFIME